MQAEVEIIRGQEIVLEHANQRALGLFKCPTANIFEIAQSFSSGYGSVYCLWLGNGLGLGLRLWFKVRIRVRV